MKKNLFFLVLICFAVVIFFKAFLLNGLLPIPSDTIVGLYHPFRDFYAKDYPNGIPFKNFLITDPVRQQYVWKNLVLESEKKLKLPLWNPYSFAGYPLLANFQSSVFYPLNLLLILPFASFWSLFILLQPLLAGIFLFLYLNNLRLARKASLLGSLTFAFCGFSIAWLEWGNILHTVLWLPLILLSIDKLLDINSRKSTIVWSIMLIFSSLSSFFAGHLQTFFYLAAFSTVYFLAKFIIGRRQLRILGIFGIIAILITVISLVQLLPTINFILLSARNLDQSWLNPGWFIPWQNVLQFFAPDFFGNPATLNYWGIWNYGEFVGYVGIVSLIFAFFAILRKDKKIIFFVAMILISLLFVLPTPLAKLPYKYALPFLSTAQPTRLLFIIDFSLSVLAALGFDYFLKVKNQIKIIYILGIFSLIFAGLWIYVFRFGKGISQINLLVARQNLIFPTVVFILSSIFIVSIILFPRKISQRETAVRFFSFLIIGLLLVDLLRFGWKYTAFTDNAYLFPTTKTTAFLEKNLGNYRIMETDSKILPPNFSNFYKFQSVDGYDPLYLQNYAEFAAAWGRGVPDIFPPFGFNRIITPENYTSDFANLLGVKYVLTFNPITEPNFKLVAEEGQTKIYENTNVLSRTFFIGRTIYANNKQSAIDLLFDKNYPLKYRAVVEGQGAENLSRAWSVGLAQIISYEENKVVIKTQNQGDGFLVLTDTNYPSWHVTIDGKEARIYKTDYNFRGVIVPKGDHILSFYISLL